MTPEEIDLLRQRVHIAALKNAVDHKGIPTEKGTMKVLYALWPEYRGKL